MDEDIAQSLIEILRIMNPIRTSLDYQGVGRKLLVVDPLPQGA